MSTCSWAVVIPAYNAEKNIGAVLEAVSPYIPIHHIVVVDDGSKDRTTEVAERWGAQVLRQKVNGGKGLALRRGFEKALSAHSDWILCLDADGQHDPGMIPHFQREADTGEFDLIIGDRTSNHHGMPYLRRFSNHTSSKLLSWKTGMNVKDAQCGYRAIRSAAFSKMTLRAEKYDIEAEMILEAWRCGLRLGWVSIPTVYQGESSYLKKLPEMWRFGKLFLRSGKRTT